MKIVFYSLLISVLLFIVACEDGVSTEAVESANASEYYPGVIGSSFTYNLDTLDQLSRNYVNVDSRNTIITDTRTINGTEYMVQENRGTNGTVEQYFRRTDNGVYFYFDTTGFSQTIALLGDSLATLINISPDEEIIALSTPFEDGKQWNAYKFNFTLSALQIDYSIVDVKATIEGMDTLSLDVFGEATEAVKIKYNITTRIPTDISNFLEPEEINYEGYSWYVKGTGLVRAEGSGVLLSFLSGTSIDFSDSLTIYRETLTSYSLE